MRNLVDENVFAKIRKKTRIENGDNSERWIEEREARGDNSIRRKRVIKVEFETENWSGACL